MALSLECCGTEQSLPASTTLGLSDQVKGAVCSRRRWPPLWSAVGKEKACLRLSPPGLSGEVGRAVHRRRQSSLKGSSMDKASQDHILDHTERHFPSARVQS